MTTLLIVPQAIEKKALLDGFRRKGYRPEPKQIGNIQGELFPTLDMVIAVGGHGKAQFALQAQHVVEQLSGPTNLFCVGAAGRLSDRLRVGDIVVGSTTIEHDYKLRFVSSPLPRHNPDTELLQKFQEMIRSNDFPFSVEVGPIASGDEDIVDTKRRKEIRERTDALCVAWEGSGGARVALFNDLRFLEIRGITDGADSVAHSSFHDNLERVMCNIVELLICSYKI